MDENTRYCSACGTPMELRLGQFECPSCGRTEQRAAPGPESAKARPGPAAGAWDPGAQYRADPGSLAPPPFPPPPTGGGYGGYSPGGLGHVAAGMSADDPLRIEKFIYLGLQSLGVLVIAFAFPWVTSYLAKHPLSASPGGPDMSAMLPGLFGFILVCSIVGLGITGLVFYLREIWLKWTCLGCYGCSALLSVAGIMFGAAAGRGGGGFIQLAIGVWFMSILYRDIQNVQSGN